VWIFVAKGFRSLRFCQLISFHRLVSSAGQGPVFISILIFAVDYVHVPPVEASDLLLVFVSAGKGACYGCRVYAWILDSACQFSWFLSCADSIAVYCSCLEFLEQLAPCSAQALLKVRSAFSRRPACFSH
jgi:hypothetical protein